MSWQEPWRMLVLSWLRRAWLPQQDPSAQKTKQTMTGANIPRLNSAIDSVKDTWLVCCGYRVVHECKPWHRYQNMRQQAMQARREEILQAGLPASDVRVERSIRQISFLVSAVVHRVRRNFPLPQHDCMSPLCMQTASKQKACGNTPDGLTACMHPKCDAQPSNAFPFGGCACSPFMSNLDSLTCKTSVSVQETCGDVERASQARAVIEVSNPDDDLERITEGSAWTVSDLGAPDMHRGTLLLRTTARSHWQHLDLHSSPQMHAPCCTTCLLAALPNPRLDSCSSPSAVSLVMYLWCW